MTHTAKVFMSGNSQVVRLPKEFQFSGKEVQIQRVGNAIVLLPVSDPWDNFRNSLDQFSDDFMEDGRRQPMDTPRDMSDVFGGFGIERGGTRIWRGQESTYRTKSENTPKLSIGL